MELRNVHLTRQADIIPEDILGTKVFIIGAGAIGSLAALSLAKMGFHNIEVWDGDTVDEVNTASQLYGPSHIGKTKVGALAEIIDVLTHTKIEFRNRWYAGENLTPKGIVLSCADSMMVRKLLFERNVYHDALIDSRMGAEFAALYSIDPKDAAQRDEYAKTLYTDEQAVQAPCTAKATAYTSGLLAGMVVKNVKDVLTNADPIGNMQWDIKNNGMTSFRKSEMFG